MVLSLVPDMAGSISSSVGWGCSSHPATGLKKLSSSSSFRCGWEQLEVCIASHSENHGLEDAKRRWRASVLPVPRVAEGKADLERKAGFGISRRTLFGLLAVALRPAVAFAEEEGENDSQKLFRQMKMKVVEKVEAKEREKAAVAATAPPAPTVKELELEQTSSEPSEAYVVSSEEPSYPDSETPTSVASTSEAPPSSSESTEASFEVPLVPPPTAEAISQTAQQLESTPSAIESTLSSVVEAVSMDVPATELTEVIEEAEGNVPVFVPFLGIAGTGLIGAIFSIIGQPEDSKVKYPSETAEGTKSESGEKTLSD